MYCLGKGTKEPLLIKLKFNDTLGIIFITTIRYKIYKQNYLLDRESPCINEKKISTTREIERTDKVMKSKPQYHNILIPGSNITCYNIY